MKNMSAVVVLGLLVFLVPSTFAGTPPPIPIANAYHRVLDAAFSRERPVVGQDGVLVVLSIMFQPSLFHESKVTLVGSKEGFEILIHSIPANEPTIWERIYGLSSYDIQGLDKLASQIRVKTERRKLKPDEGKKLLEEFSAFRVSPIAGRWDVLDGIGYQVYFENLATRFVLQSANPNKEKEPLFQWVEGIRIRFFGK